MHIINTREIYREKKIVITLKVWTLFELLQLLCYTLFFFFEMVMNNVDNNNNNDDEMKIKQKYSNVFEWEMNKKTADT